MRHITIFLLLFFDSLGVFCQAPKIDHIISLIPYDQYRSLQENLREDGFTIKEGSQHKNGLLNAHVKFANGSSIELMTINGIPNDDISEEYLKLMAIKPTGVYIALGGFNKEFIVKSLISMEVDFMEKTTSGWHYITLENETLLGAFFFIEMTTNDEYDSTYHVHPNNANKIQSVYIEGNAVSHKFLTNIGLKKLKIWNDPHLGNCTAYATDTGSIVIVDRDGSKSTRPKIIKVDIANKDGDLFYSWRF